MKILLTAFVPFGGHAENPSELVLQQLPDTLGGVNLVKVLLPVTFCGCASKLLEAFDREKPDAVLCLGLAASREALTPERVAINVDDAPIADNDSFMPADLPIVPDGPAAYFSTLPIKAMRDAIRATGLPSEISDTAGTYVCNHLMYSVLHRAAGCTPDVRAGFIHLPMWDAERLLPGVLAAIRAIAASARGV